MAREAGDSPVSGSQDTGGSARWELLDSGLSLDDGARVIQLAKSLGLVSNVSPSRIDVDYLLILGGARLSNVLRPQYAAELLATGSANPKHIVLLGGSRPVMETERDATDSYAPGAGTEFDLLTMAAARVFGFDPDARQEEVHHDSNPAAQWQIWHLDAASTSVGVPITAIEAPSSEPSARRATTADSYVFFANSLELKTQDASLLVTSQIYVPYQHLEAMRSLALPFELELETVGFPPDWQAELQGMQAPVNYLQETRSAILSARRLYEDHLR